MNADSGKQLDITSAPASPPSERTAAARKVLGVHFFCCDAYSRIYANATNTAYVGHCPRCGKRVEFKIGPGGSSSRFFSAQ